MARASKRVGVGKQRGSTNRRETYSTQSPNSPQNGDRWIKKPGRQAYVYDRDNAAWLEINGGLHSLESVNTSSVVTVSSLTTVAHVTATALVTDSKVIATACLNGNASEAMTVTSYVMINTTTVNTLIQSVASGNDQIININTVISSVPSGTNDIWVQQVPSAGNWVLKADEQQLYTLNYYD